MYCPLSWFSSGPPRPAAQRVFLCSRSLFASSTAAGGSASHPATTSSLPACPLCEYLGRAHLIPWPSTAPRAHLMPSAQAPSGQPLPQAAIAYPTPQAAMAYPTPQAAMAYPTPQAATKRQSATRTQETAEDDESDGSDDSDSHENGVLLPPAPAAKSDDTPDAEADQDNGGSKRQTKRAKKPPPPQPSIPTRTAEAPINEFAAIPAFDPSVLRCRSALELFKLYFEEPLWDHMVECTNKYGRAWAAEAENPWTDCTKDELMAFVGVLLHMRESHKPDLREYWVGTTLDLFCHQVFPRDRFLELFRCIHFADTDHAPDPRDTRRDRLFRLRTLYDSVRRRCREVAGVLGKDVVIDEMMVAFTGRTAMRVYMPAKPQKWGFKRENMLLYALVDCATNLLADFMIYTGKRDPEAIGKPEDIVMELLKGYTGSWRVLFCDNWYTSPALVQHLLDRQTYCAGTLQLRRKEGGSRPFGNVFAQGPFTFTVWQDKKPVVILSTGVKTLDTQQVTRWLGDSKVGYRRVNDVPCPSAVHSYRCHMGGVDLFDQFRASHEVCRRSSRWYLHLFFFMVNCSAINAWRLAAHISKHPPAGGVPPNFPLSLGKGELRPFLAQLSQELVGTFTARQQRFLVVLPTTHLHMPRYSPASFTCEWCRQEKKPRSRSRFFCPDCPPPTGRHPPPHLYLCVSCFEPYHRHLWPKGLLPA
ncbi:putative PiggyBac transposable element-derived protein 5 [Paratrimastix pyriformis]|uniref:PiggyBac transposable element-derived protein 5 n=1 Tax=Paratrimastix pyriformis TaxID=342808 RepID=A0ABQ8UI97_9EUKA|nr:putative PiggyBac transposable element-derived protein 5 [Paratrimastix pyriformis]